MPRTSYIERTRGFVVTPNWPGGRQPVQVDLKATRPQGGQVEGQTQVFSTVQVALGDWITVARSGSLHPPGSWDPTSNAYAIEAATLALDPVQRALAGKAPKKIIVVPQRIVNVVA